MARFSYENLEKAIYPGVGMYGMPEIQPIYEMPDIKYWLNFCQATNKRADRENLKEYGVHFFIDDYRFNRVWDKPDQYVDKLREYGAVLSPDFSMFTDFPLVVQIFNSYRRHWLGAYWQEHGVTVIPTIGWSTRESFEWCYDGDPSGGIVAVSSVGCTNDRTVGQLFLDGYAEMMSRLKPKAVLFQGKIMPGCNGNIIKIPTYYVQRGPLFTEEWVGIK